MTTPSALAGDVHVSALSDGTTGDEQAVPLSQGFPEPAVANSSISDTVHEQGLLGSEHGREPGSAEDCTDVDSEACSMASGRSLSQRAVALLPSWKAVLLLTVGGASAIYAANRLRGWRGSVNESNLFPT